MDALPNLKKLCVGYCAEVMQEPNVQFAACFYDFMLHNAFVLQQQESLEFDFGINSNSDVDLIHK